MPTSPPHRNPHRNEKGRFRAPTPEERDIDIRSETDVGTLDGMIHSGAPTFVLIYADWCGHCHRYLPTWADLEKTPGRTAHMARVHYDMQEKIPALKDAKIQGYPSVVKVLPDGSLQTYPAEGGEATNAMPTMRDLDVMKNELTASNMSVGQSGGSRSRRTTRRSQQTGGSVLGAFVSALQAAGPAGLLLMTAATRMKKRGGARGKSRKHRIRSFRSPKRATRRASTRRSRSRV